MTSPRYTCLCVSCKMVRFRLLSVALVRFRLLSVAHGALSALLAKTLRATLALTTHRAQVGAGLQAPGGVASAILPQSIGGIGSDESAVMASAAREMQRQMSAPATEGSSGAEEGQAAGKGKGKGKAGRKFNPRNPGRTGEPCCVNWYQGLQQAGNGRDKTTYCPRANLYRSKV